MWVFGSYDQVEASKTGEIDGVVEMEPDLFSKQEIDRFRPLEKPMVDQVKAYYRVGLTYSSNALEGNSLTETETKVLLEDGITIAGKPLRELYEGTSEWHACS